MPYLNVLAKFRDDVRIIARKQKGHKSASFAYVVCACTMKTVFVDAPCMVCLLPAIHTDALSLLHVSPQTSWTVDKTSLCLTTLQLMSCYLCVMTSETRCCRSWESDSRTTKVRYTLSVVDEILYYC